MIPSSPHSSPSPERTQLYVEAVTPPGTASQAQLVLLQAPSGASGYLLPRLVEVDLAQLASRAPVQVRVCRYVHSRVPVQILGL